MGQDWITAIILIMCYLFEIKVFVTCLEIKAFVTCLEIKVFVTCLEIKAFVTCLKSEPVLHILDETVGYRRHYYLQ